MYFKNKIFVSMVVLVFLMSLLVIGCAGKAEEQASEPANSSETKETIIVGTSGDFFPLNFKKDGELQGFEIDIWNEISKRTEYEVEYKTSKFVGLFGMLDVGKIDTICHQIAIKPEREEKYFFTEPYVYATYNLVTKKDSELSKLEDFKGKKVGVVMGGMGEKMLKEASEKNGLDLQVQGYEGPSGMNTDLEMGRIDARLAPAVQMRTAIKEKNLDFKVTDAVIFYETAAFPFLKNDESKEKVAKASEALKSMKEDGTLSELSNKWFGVDATVKK